MQVRSVPNAALPLWAALIAGRVMHRVTRFCVRWAPGVAHSRIMPPVTYAQLLENGWTRHAIQGAVAGGSLRRVARGWYDVGGCSADELTAAAAGGRLGCLKGLRDQGVWVAPNTHPHIITTRWPGARCGLEVRSPTAWSSVCDRSCGTTTWRQP